MTNLGTATESRFAAAFADCAILPGNRAARLLGLDEKTLRAMSDAGIVRAVRKGRLRGYTERDLRAYLLEGPDVKCREKNSRPAPALRARKVVLFSDIQSGKGR